MLKRYFAETYYRTRPTWKLYRQLLRTQHLPIQDLYTMQLHKAKKLAQYASEYFPYWQHRFEQAEFNPHKINSLEDFQRLPVLQKGDLQDILRTAEPQNGLIRMRSGGTTGTPTTTYATANHIFWSQAALLRFYSWIGYKLGEKRAKVFSSPTEAGFPHLTKTARFRNWASNTLLIDAWDLKPEAIDEIARTLNSFQPRLLIGYTSCLSVIANHILTTNLSINIPSLAIINAAEPLYPSTRQRIESAFGARIFNHYGTRDVASNIADECQPGQGLLVHMEYLLVEIVDEAGDWVAPGEEGDIVITQLENYGVPLIRYKVGDRAKRVEENRSCERALQLIPEILARSTDVIVLPNGNKVTVLVRHILKDFPILEFQVVQKRLDYVEANIVPAREIDDREKSRIKKALENLLPDIVVKIDYVETIPKSASGKVRSVISELEA